VPIEGLLASGPPKRRTRLRAVALLARPAGLIVLERSLLRNPDIELAAVATHRLRPASEDSSRGERAEHRAFETLCRTHEIPLIAIDDALAARSLEPLQPFEPFDLLCSVSWRYILTTSALERPKVAGINLHRGKLPEYAGAEPVRRMIEAGERDAIITAHVMVEEVDAGEILGTASVSIPALEGRTSAELAEVVKNELLVHYPPLMDAAIRIIADRLAAGSSG
jgi:methionyl-tRNA formyltransferase